MSTTRDALYQRAVEKNLRRTTVLSYERLLARLGLLDLETTEVTREQVLEGLWAIESPNTRRAAVVAVRAVLGLEIKVPRSIPRRYTLPDEDTLRLALMTSPHETRLLAMAYAGLRVGEACAVTGADLDGDRLRVTRQVIEEHRTGEPTVIRLAPVKSTEAAIVVPLWLAERLAGLDGTERPGSVRESLRRAGRRVGIDLNPHQLRHYYATTLLERGVPLVVVSRQLRHSDIATTLRTYAQANDGVEVHRALG
jgi:integrase